MTYFVASQVFKIRYTCRKTNAQSVVMQGDDDQLTSNIICSLKGPF